MASEESVASGSKSQKVWALVGKILAGLAALATLIAGSFALYDRFTSAANLTVTIASSKYHTPPRFVDDGDKRKLDDEYVESWKRPPDYKGYIRVTVENTGGTQAENVVFTLPYQGVAHVFSDKDPVRSIEFSQSIDIGIIAPSRTVTVQAWTEEEPAKFREDELLVTHSNGVAGIVFLRQTDGFWRTLGRGLFKIGQLLLAMACLTVAIGLITNLLTKWSTPKAAGEIPPPGEKSGTEPPDKPQG